MQMLFGTLLEWGCALPSSTNKAACGGAALLLLLLRANHQTTAAAWFQNKDLLLKLGKALNPVGRPVLGRTAGPVPKRGGAERGQKEYFSAGIFRSIKGLLTNYPRYDSGGELRPLPSSQVAPGGFGVKGRESPAIPGSRVVGWKSGGAQGGSRLRGDFWHQQSLRPPQFCGY